jgi:hypothetical protein
MLYIIAAILIGWAVSGWAGFRWAGYPEKVVWVKHPAAACADCALSGHRFMEVVIMVAVLLACLAGCVLLPDGAVFLCEAVILFLVVPLPYYFFDAARRDHRLRSYEFVHFNVLTPPTTHQERESLDGRLVDVGPQLVFFISEKQWAKKKYISDTERKYLTTFMVAPGLYMTKATNDVLQTFDSLNLYEHILNPENTAAIEAFKTALKDSEDLRIRVDALNRLLQSESAPASQPPPAAKKTTAAATPPKTAPVAKAAAVAPLVQIPAVEEAPEVETEPAEEEEEVVAPPEPPLAERPETQAQIEGRTMGITLPDLDPVLPPMPGMTATVVALNTPDKHKGARKARRKKSDPDQESLGLGSVHSAPASPLSPADNNGESEGHEP